MTRERKTETNNAVRECAFEGQRSNIPQIGKIKTSGNAAHDYQLPSPILLNKNGLKIAPPSLMRKYCNGKKMNSQSKSQYRTPDAHSNMNNPSCLSSDRFIPNRSHLRPHISRSSILAADKRRCDAIENNKSKSNNKGGQSQSLLTPLENEFRLRMRSALLDIPLNEFKRPEVSNNMNTVRRLASHNNRTTYHEGNVNYPGQTPQPTLPPLSMSITDSSFASSISSSRGESYNLAYASLPELEDELSSSDGGHFSSSECGGGDDRILSFRSNSSNNMDSSFTSTSVSSAIHSYATPTKIKKRASVTCSPVVASNPYFHDQLHVLQQTAIYSSPKNIDYIDLAEHGLMSLTKQSGRKINATPTRILDAPKFVDDYYLNLLSWGTNNILAVALGQSVYLWDAISSSTTLLVSLSEPDAYVTSVKWGKSSYLAVGTSEGPIQLWDTKVMKQVRTLRGHSARVSSLSWNHNCLSSGGRDSVILQHDARCVDNIISIYTGHTQEVCGLMWNEDGDTLASGGNDNYLCLWDATMSSRSMSRREATNNHTSSQSSKHAGIGYQYVKPRLMLTHHKAAVKALAWCPFHRGLLASGGGKEDGTVKFWNSNFGTLMNSIDTGSQVCSLLWSRHNREICSSHGYSDNQLTLWRYPAMKKIQEFKSHTARVLHMEQSPDGACVVSAAADETLQFWDVFGSPHRKVQSDGGDPIGGLIGQQCTIR